MSKEFKVDYAEQAEDIGVLKETFEDVNASLTDRMAMLGQEVKEEIRSLRQQFKKATNSIHKTSAAEPTNTAQQQQVVDESLKRMISEKCDTIELKKGLE